MTRVKTIGVAGGGGDAGRLNSDTRCVACTAISAAYMRAAGTWFEGRA